jgi:hypothetical protein
MEKVQIFSWLKIDLEIILINQFTIFFANF